MSFWSSDLLLYLLPLPAASLAAIIACFERWRTGQWNVPVAIALGIPIPLAVSYFLFFAQVLLRYEGPILMTFITPQAFILTAIGIWFLIAAVRRCVFSHLSSFAIILIGTLGHAWTIMVVVALSSGRYD
jgi:hypothetical protein